MPVKLYHECAALVTANYICIFSGDMFINSDEAVAGIQLLFYVIKKYLQIWYLLTSAYLNVVNVDITFSFYFATFLGMLSLDNNYKCLKSLGIS